MTDICHICQEDQTVPELFVLTCGHKFHLECLKHMINDVCPLCRTTASNLPPSVRAMIAEKKVNYNQEQFEDLFIQEMIEHVMSRPPIELEILMAAEYILSKGIPSFFFPTDIFIEVQKTIQNMYNGFVRDMFVNNVIKNISYLCFDYIVDDSNPWEFVSVVDKILAESSEEEEYDQEHIDDVYDRILSSIHIDMV